MVLSAIELLILPHLADNFGVRGFDSRRELGIFLFSTASRPVLGPNQLPVKWVSGGTFPGGKAAQREANNLPCSSAEVKNA
jgi:hypothetical protein